jgi:alkylhydroperoxidase family enzyme
MTLEPTRMTAEDWQPLRDAGLDDEGLLEAAHVIAIFNYFPRLADGFGLVPDPKVREAGETGVALKRVES